MSDDLVKRLRELNTFEWHARPATTKEVCLEAANRIEKLEAALRAIIVHCEVPAPPNVEALKMFARKALEGKDD
jgi:hypothetical protein